MEIWLLTIYQNGVRFYSAPVPPPTTSERSGKDISISAKTLLVSYEKKDGEYCFISIKQALSDAEFCLYKKSPLDFTSKQVY